MFPVGIARYGAIGADNNALTACALKDLFRFCLDFFLRAGIEHFCFQIAKAA